MPTKLGRRRLLQGLGASALGLPFLHSAPSAAHDVFPKRILFWFTPNEFMDEQHWRPGPGDDFALDQLPEILSPLQPHKDKLLMLGNLEFHTWREDWPAGHVGAGHVLTGHENIEESYQAEAIIYLAGGQSVDQYIAERLGVKALNLAVTPPPNLSNGNARITYSAAGQVVDPHSDPRKAFDDVFAGFEGPPELQDALRNQKMSMLDTVAGNLERVRATLPSEDRIKLERHLDGIEALEDKLGNPPELTCEQPMAPSVPGGYDPDANHLVPLTHRMHMDVMVEALACGATSVGTIQLVGAGGGISMDWGNDPINPLSIPKDMHTLAHDYANDETNDPVIHSWRMDMEKWTAAQFVYMLEALEAVPEGDGTLLDNTLVVWCKELGYAHIPQNMLFILAGGTNLGLDGKLGRFRYLPSAPDTTPHNDLLVSCCNLVGLDDVTCYGDPAYCTGPIPI